jgi:hypothetical protein
MDKGNKGEETIRIAEAVLAHPGSHCSSESLKAGESPGVAHAIGLEQVVDMPDMALDLCALACCYRHSECLAALDDYPAVGSVVKALSCFQGGVVLKSEIC